MATKKPKIEHEVEVTGLGVDEALTLLQKALASKRGGAAIADRGHVKFTGEFERKGILFYDIAGNVGKDYEGDRFDGVELNTVINMLIAVVPGFTDNHIRKAIAIAVEMKRAANENRDIADIVWVDNEAVSHELKAEEIAEVTERTKARVEAAKEMVAPLSKIIKQKVPCDGKVDIHRVIIDVRPYEAVKIPLADAA